MTDGNKGSSARWSIRILPSIFGRNSSTANASVT